MPFVHPDAERFFDIFAGTGTVGWYFKQKGFSIVANDIQYYAYCLNRAYVGMNRPPAFSRLRQEIGLPARRSFLSVLRAINATRPRRGFVFQNYCPGGSSTQKRIYFSDSNGRRCDGIRQQIEEWLRDGLIKESEYYYLLASLIVAMDRVANTASVYAAYLKRLKKSAQRDFVLDSVPTSGGRGRHAVYHKNGQDLVGRIACDILYMDPPYNQRQYCTNYHVLETIAAYDNPPLIGKTGLRPYDEQRSDFCVKARALGALEDMVQRTRAQYVFLSYNSEGLMAKRDILDVMRAYGTADVRSKRYPRFRADVDSPNRKYKANSVTEYLFRLKKLR
ncbi:DNA adenine methylase [bacterium]|nr:DNA adenine methylase [bacterium]